ncbi:MAG: hypothetical protein ACLSTV_00005, partial [Coriobacteriales bacterium]
MYNLKDVAEKPADGQTITHANAAGYADDAVMKVTVSENWNTGSRYLLCPQIVNTGTETLKVSFYIRSVDSQYRKIRIELTEGIGGVWKGYGTDLIKMEKATWTFVSFDLAPGQAFYMTAQWWKDVNGNEKYMIGYQMELEIG